MVKLFNRNCTVCLIARLKTLSPGCRYVISMDFRRGISAHSLCD